MLLITIFEDILYFFKRMVTKSMILFYTFHLSKKLLFNLKNFTKCNLLIHVYLSTYYAVSWIYHIIIHVKWHIDCHCINIRCFALIFQLNSIIILDFFELILFDNCLHRPIMLQGILKWIYIIIVRVKHIFPNLETFMLAKLYFKSIRINCWSLNKILSWIS